ncbi:MAG: hypothetical protein LUQ12_04990 [Methanoregulaceae archaeon]|nr:hypothetical protein [Methanoregulaceae archaeon]
MRKRIIPALLFLALLVGAVQAYVIAIDAPEEIQAGAPLEVTGTTTFPAGTQFDIILYRTQFTTPELVDRRMIVVDESKTFDASFPTTSLPAGQYKVEIQFLQDPGSSLGSSSVTIRLVNLIDRSGEIVLTVPKDQSLDEALVIEGYIPEIGIATITLKIDGPKGYSLPEQNIRTTTTLGSKNGYFSKRVNVTEPGNYYVNVNDSKGFIAQLRYSVTDSPVVTETTTETPGVTGTTLPASPGLPVPVAGMIAGLIIAAALVAWKRK